MWGSAGCCRCSTSNYSTTWFDVGTVTSTTSTTTTHYTLCRYCDYTVTATSNYRAFKADLPKAEHNSVIQMRRIRLLAIRMPYPRHRAQRQCGRSPVARLPRQKIRRWKSLKEKREGWGLL